MENVKIRDVSHHLKHGTICIKNNRPNGGKYFNMFCCRCLNKRRATPLTCIVICLLVLTYNLFGGYIFFAIESPNNGKSISPSSPHNQTLSDIIRLQTVGRLWSITEELNILYKNNWTQLANKELINFQNLVKESLLHEIKNQMKENSKKAQWNFPSSFLYALTLITTIGGGNVNPTTIIGKIFAIGYSCFSIPLIFFYFSTVGEMLARKFRSFYSKFCPKRFKIKNFHSKAECINHCYCNASAAVHKNKSINEEDVTPFQSALNLHISSGEYHWMCQDHTRVPIFSSVLLVGLYVTMGAFIFRETEDWNFVDACFFSFSVLATIGFGNFKPGLHASTYSASRENIAIGICCAYILFGVVIVAMCFNLIQDDIGLTLRRFTSLCMKKSKSRAIYNIQVGEESTFTSDI